MNKYFLSCILAGLTLSALADDRSLRLAEEAITVQNLKVGKTADNFVLDMDLCLDSLDMPSNERFVFTPIVGDGSNERFMPQLVVNGRKQQIMYQRHGYKDFEEGTQVVRRQNGDPQTLHYSAVLPYEPWMQNANVEIAEDLCGCGDILEQNRTLIHRLRRPLIAYLRPQAEARKARHEEGRAFLDFPVDRIELYPDYRKNPRELEKILSTIELVKKDPNVSITGISIHGYASPEGNYAHNEYLAENRAKTLKDYVAGRLDIDESLFRVESTPEDWEGLLRYLRENNIENKEELLAIAQDEDLTYDQRDLKMRATYPQAYRYMLDNWYPALRHSDYVVNYSVRPFSVDEAKELIHTKPQQLSLEEMYLVAQTYEPGSKEFNEVFEIAVRMFPDDPTANLNAACTRIEREDYDGAEAYLRKADSSPYVDHARAVIALRRGQTEEARTLFRKAQQGGVPEAAENLKLLDLDR